MAHALDCPRSGVYGKRATIKCTCGDTARKQRASAEALERQRARRLDPDQAPGNDAQRLAQLEAFVREIEVIETAWVTGMTGSLDAMRGVSEAWQKVRAPS